MKTANVSQYGLSFVHIDEAESAAVAAPAPPPLQLTFDASSDEDEFKPGELFAKHLKKNSTETKINNTLNTSNFLINLFYWNTFNTYVVCVLSVF